MNKKTLIAILLLSIFLLNCGGGGSGGSSSPNGEKPGVPEIVQILPSHYIALTNSAILIRAKILNGNGGPVKDYPVTFTNLSPIGTLINSNDVAVGNKTVVKTNNSGMATIKLKSTISGFATVLAEVAKGVGIVRDRKTVYFSSSLSFVPFMYLDANGDTDTVYNEVSDYTLFENENDNKVTMRATVFSKFGQREAGSTVVFSSDSTEVTFPGGSTATTNADGEAFVLVQVDPAALRNLWTYINIAAFADNGAAAIYTLYLQPVIVNSLTVTANPSIIAPNGTSTIQASVKLNTGGAPPDGSAVNFVTTCGSVTPFSQTTSGLATATFTAPSTVPTPDPACRVTATLAGVTNFADVIISSALNVQPPSQIINANYGGTASYTIYGGIAPYTVISNNKAHACNSTDADCSDATDTGTWNVADNGGIFTATVPANITTANESITFTVRDSVGNTTTATLSIGGAASLAVLPSAVTIDGTAGGDITFTIYGGNPGYNIFVNKADPAFAPNPVSVGSSGSTFKATIPANTSAGTVIYTVRDSLGETTTATVTIVAPSTPSLAVLPGSITVNGAAPPETVTYSIFGGKTPYNVFSNNPLYPPSATTVSTSGGTFTATVPAGSAATTVTFTVRDANGTTANAQLVISDTAAPSLLILPSSQSVVAPGTVSFTVSGGTPPYIITSTDPSSACNSADPDCSDPTDTGIWNTSPVTVTVPSTAVAGNVTLNVFDSTGATKSATLTIISGGAATGITINPASISVTGLAGSTDNVKFTINGGTSPYTVFSTNTAIAEVVATTATTFTVDPKVVAASTAATLTVVDSLGASKTATITVTPFSSSLGVNPSTLAVTEGTNDIGFNIIGGIWPYTVYSSNVSVISLDGGGGTGPFQPVGTFFTADAVGPGSATIAIVDDDGKTVTSTITVTALAALSSIPTSGTSIGINNDGLGGCTEAASNTADDLTFFISGGIPPYSASSNNLAVIPNCALSWTGNTLTVDPDNVGGSTIVAVTISDSALPPQTLNINITVTP